MFGYILNFAKNNNYFVTIYSNDLHNQGSFDFYKTIFQNYKVLDYKEYSSSKQNNYKYIFLTTSYDRNFEYNNMNNIISIVHSSTNEIKFKYNLTLCKLKNSNLPYAIPCYPIYKANDKQRNNTISLIGNSLDKNKYIIEKLKSNSKITLNIINRHKKDYENKNKNLIVNFYVDPTTSELMNILKKSTFIIINYTSAKDEDENSYGERASGSIPLAYTTLNKIIIGNKFNKIYGLKNVYEFNDDQPFINLDEIPVDFTGLEKTRDEYILMFDNYIKNIH